MITSHAPLVSADGAWRTLVEQSIYSISAMSWGTVELGPEVRDSLERLPVETFATVAFYVDLLSEEGPLLGEPLAATWIDVVTTAHDLGIRSSCTTMDGHVDNPSHGLGHLRTLARIHDRTGGSPGSWR